jgi:hypothetical protein
VWELIEASANFQGKPGDLTFACRTHGSRSGFVTQNNRIVTITQKDIFVCKFIFSFRGIMAAAPGVVRATASVSTSSRPRACRWGSCRYVARWAKRRFGNFARHWLWALFVFLIHVRIVPTSPAAHLAHCSGAYAGDARLGGGVAGAAARAVV